MQKPHHASQLKKQLGVGAQLTCLLHHPTGLHGAVLCPKRAVSHGAAGDGAPGPGCNGPLTL